MPLPEPPIQLSLTDLADSAAVRHQIWLSSPSGEESGKCRHCLGLIESLRIGSRYRFRLISMACEPNFIFSIDNHPLTVIEADGVSTQPLTVDEVQVFPAQRYSFVVCHICSAPSVSRLPFISYSSMPIKPSGTIGFELSRMRGVRLSMVDSIPRSFAMLGPRRKTPTLLRIPALFCYKKQAFTPSPSARW